MYTPRVSADRFLQTEMGRSRAMASALKGEAPSSSSSSSSRGAAAFSTAAGSTLRTALRADPPPQAYPTPQQDESTQRSLQGEIDRLKRKLNSVISSAEDVLQDASLAQSETKLACDSQVAHLDAQINTLVSDNSFLRRRLEQCSKELEETRKAKAAAEMESAAHRARLQIASSSSSSSSSSADPAAALQNDASAPASELAASTEVSRLRRLLLSSQAQLDQRQGEARAELQRRQVVEAQLQASRGETAAALLLLQALSRAEKCLETECRRYLEALSSRHDQQLQLLQHQQRQYQQGRERRQQDGADDGEAEGGNAGGAEVSYIDSLYDSLDVSAVDMRGAADPDDEDEESDVEGREEQMGHTEQKEDRRSGGRRRPQTMTMRSAIDARGPERAERAEASRGPEGQARSTAESLRQSVATLQALGVALPEAALSALQRRRRDVQETEGTLFISLSLYLSLSLALSLSLSLSLFLSLSFSLSLSLSSSSSHINAALLDPTQERKLTHSLSPPPLTLHPSTHTSPPSPSPAAARPCGRGKDRGAARRLGPHQRRSHAPLQPARGAGCQDRRAARWAMAGEERGLGWHGRGVFIQRHSQHSKTPPKQPPMQPPPQTNRQTLRPTRQPRAGQGRNPLLPAARDRSARPDERRAGLYTKPSPVRARRNASQASRRRAA